MQATLPWGNFYVSVIIEKPIVFSLVVQRGSDCWQKCGRSLSRRLNRIILSPDPMPLKPILDSPRYNEQEIILFGNCISRPDTLGIYHFNNYEYLGCLAYFRSPFIRWYLRYLPPRIFFPGISIFGSREYSSGFSGPYKLYFYPSGHEI